MENCGQSNKLTTSPSTSGTESSVQTSNGITEQAGLGGGVVAQELQGGNAVDGNHGSTSSDMGIECRSSKGGSKLRRSDIAPNHADFDTAGGVLEQCDTEWSQLLSTNKYRRACERRVGIILGIHGVEEVCRNVAKERSTKKSMLSKDEATKSEIKANCITDHRTKSM